MMGNDKTTVENQYGPIVYCIYIKSTTKIMIFNRTPNFLRKKNDYFIKLLNFIYNIEFVNYMFSEIVMFILL